MADTHRIHLVPRPQVHPSTPPELDPADIVSEVRSTIRECRRALVECEEYMAMIRGELASRLNQLEVVALCSMAEKARR